MINRRFPILTAHAGGTSPAAEIELLRQAVKLAEQQLGQVPQVGEGKSQDGSLREAETAAKLAEANWQEMWDANNRMPGVINTCEIERLHLIARITQLHLAETRVARIQSELNRLVYRVNKLDEEVHRLRDRMAVLSVRN